MKKILVIGFISLIGANAFGAMIKSAKLDAENEYILIDVTYGGGCGDHKFSLKARSCFETAPVQCKANLIEDTHDPCEALISGTVVIPLQKYGFTDPYYKDGTLTITGDKDWQTNQPSAATVRLP